MSAPEHLMVILSLLAASCGFWEAFHGDSAKAAWMAGHACWLLLMMIGAEVMLP